MPVTRLSLGSRRFRWVLSATCLTSFAEFLVEAIIYAWIATSPSFDDSQRPVLIGAYIVFSTTPRILSGILLGVTVDRVGGTRALLISSLGRTGVLLASLCMMIVSGHDEHLTAILLIVATSILSALNQLFFIARAVVVREVVPPEHRPHAASLSMAVLTSASIVAAAAGPAVLIGLGLVGSLFIANCLFALGAFVSSRVGYDCSEDAVQESTAPEKGFFASLVEGWAVSWGVSELRYVLVGATIYGIPLGLNNVALILLWTAGKGFTVVEFGLASSLFGIGALIGSLVTPVFISRLGLRVVFVAVLCIMGLTYVGLGLVDAMVPSFVFMFLAGVFVSAYGVAQGPLLQNAAPPELLGRVSATVSSASAVSSLVASGLAAALFALVPVASVYGITVAAGGVLAVLGGALICAPVRASVAGGSSRAEL